MKRHVIRYDKQQIRPILRLKQVYQHSDRRTESTLAPSENCYVTVLTHAVNDGQRSFTYRTHVYADQELE